MSSNALARRPNSSGVWGTAVRADRSPFPSRSLAATRRRRGWATQRVPKPQASPAASRAARPRIPRFFSISAFAARSTGVLGQADEEVEVGRRVRAKTQPLEGDDPLEPGPGRPARRPPPLGPARRPARRRRGATGWPAGNRRALRQAHQPHPPVIGEHRGAASRKIHLGPGTGRRRPAWTPATTMASSFPLGVHHGVGVVERRDLAEPADDGLADGELPAWRWRSRMCLRSARLTLPGVKGVEAATRFAVRGRSARIVE